MWWRFVKHAAEIKKKVEICKKWGGDLEKNAVEICKKNAVDICKNMRWRFVTNAVKICIHCISIYENIMPPKKSKKNILCSDRSEI
jgi:hypothetical protein